MNIYLVKKQKGRKYASEEIVPLLLEHLDLSGLSFSHNENKAPQLKGDKDLHISISDTKNYWVCVLFDWAVGIDIEEKSRTVSAKTVSALHQREQKYLEGLEAGSKEWTEEFLHIWTRKESYSKYCGEGLRIGFKKFSVIDEVLEPSVTVCAQFYPAGRLMDFAYYSLTGAVCLPPDSTDTDICIVPFDYSGKAEISAKTAAIEILEMRDHSSSELISKLLKKGYTKEEAEEAAYEMADKGFTDDRAYAQRIAELCVQDGKATGRIRQELYKKGISNDIISDVLYELKNSDGYSEENNARKEAEKLLRSYDRPYEEKILAKLARKLSSLGYSPSVIYSLLDDYRD